MGKEEEKLTTPLMASKDNTDHVADLEKGIANPKASSPNLSATSSGQSNLRFNALKSSVWTIQHLLQYFLWTAWALVLMFALGGKWAFTDGGDPSCDLREPSKNKPICDVLYSFQRARREMWLLSAFILAGFVRSSRSTWMERRTRYKRLTGSTKNLLINVCSIVPHPHKKIFARWVILGFELAVLKTRNHMDSEEGRKFLELSNLLAEDEWDCMDHDGNRQTTVWFWIQSKAKLLRDNGKIDAEEFQTICTAITTQRSAASDIMSKLNMDQPPPYVYVTALLVNVNLFYISTDAGLRFAQLRNEDKFGPWIFVELVSLYFLTSIYAMIFDHCAVLYNPFGPRDIDVNHNSQAKKLRGLSVLYSSEDKKYTPKAMAMAMSGCDCDFDSANEEEVYNADSNIRFQVRGSNQRNTLYTGLNKRRTLVSWDEEAE